MRNLRLTGKLVLIASILLLADITTRYIFERIDLFSVRPMTIPNYNSNHLINIVSAFPYLFVVAGWSFILVTVIYYFFKKKSKYAWYINSMIGFILCMIFYLIFWLFDRGGDDNGVSLLKESFAVYIVLGLLMEAIFTIMNLRGDHRRQTRVTEKRI